jgi:peptidoglycan/LPS O-acetylase OafA/YrhL
LALQYRAEIDGLRALAVLPVVFFHAGFDFFNGGFVGVDIFFVISGYLITTLILHDIQNDQFSLIRFYERRARRILPALALVMISCIPFAWAWMLPTDFEKFLASLVATTFFLSNFFFYKNIGDYFGTVAEESPLLHTWSLSVEEHFYLGFPILLLIMRYRHTTDIKKVIALLIIATVAISEVTIAAKPVASFYFSAFRFWEIAVGSFAALTLQSKDSTPPSANQLISFVGLILIGLSLVVYDISSGFPGIPALLPVLGTYLVIVYGRGPGPVSALLRISFLRKIGLISYSLYLWHQPIFAFARIRSIEPIDALTMTFLILLVFMLASLSWYFVEQPFRNRLSFKSASYFLGLIFGAVLCVSWLAKPLAHSDMRLNRNVLELLDQNTYKNPYRDTCLLTTENNLFKHPVEECSEFAVSDGFSILMMGDSHLDAMSYALQTSLKESGIGSYSVGYAGCMPFRQLKRVGLDDTHRCKEYTHSMIEFARTSQIGAILIVARFPLYLEGSYYDNGEDGIEYRGFAGVDTISTSRETESNSRKRRVAELITQEIKELSSEFKIIILEPTPEVGWPVIQRHAKQLLFNNTTTEITHSLIARDHRIKAWNEIIENSTSDRLYYLETTNLFCDRQTGRCATQNLKNEYLYRDGDHLSKQGAELVAAKIVPAIIQILKNE